MKQVKTIGLVEDGAFLQASNCLEDAEEFCLMADNHKKLWYACRGSRSVYKDKISPSGVGFDIACGNKAVKTNLKYEDIKDNVSYFSRFN